MGGGGLGKLPKEWETTKFGMPYSHVFRSIRGTLIAAHPQCEGKLFCFFGKVGNQSKNHAEINRDAILSEVLMRQCDLLRRKLWNVTLTPQSMSAYNKLCWLNSYLLFLTGFVIL